MTGFMFAGRHPGWALQRVKWISFVFTILLLSGCSEKYKIDVLDLDSENPLFQFKKSLITPPFLESSVVVRKIVVAEKLDGNNTASVWQVSSGMEEGVNMKEVRYGVVPPGFSEKLKPQLLMPGKEYVVVVEGPGQFGVTVFTISPPPGH